MQVPAWVASAYCSLTLSIAGSTSGLVPARSAGLSWVLVVGWADPGDHALGVGYAKRVKAALAPCTALPEPYVNFNDFSSGES